MVLKPISSFLVFFGGILFNNENVTIFFSKNSQHGQFSRNFLTQNSLQLYKNNIAIVEGENSNKYQKTFKKNLEHLQLSSANFLKKAALLLKSFDRKNLLKSCLWVSNGK